MKPFALKTCAALVLVATAVPWSGAQAAPNASAPEMTCTGATQATLKPGLNATTKDFDIKIEETILECDDNRQDADPLIIGARVKGIGTTKGNGSCSKFTAPIDVQIDWITANGVKPQRSRAKAVFDLDLTVQPVKLVVTREITDGLFKGYQIAADTPVVALDAFAKACESPEGLTQVVGRHSINLSR